MRYTPALLALVAVAALADEPLYVLEFPGIAFGWFPDELTPPVEGSLTVESGAIASSPGSSGVEYHIHYWQEDPGADGAGEWLTERLENTLSPDLPGFYNLGDVKWAQGSTKSPFWEDSSVGIVVTVNFNFLDDAGGVLANGKAIALFVGDYSLLVYGISPGDMYPTAAPVVDEIVAWAYRTD
jgi:hypothetical protein